MNYVLIGLALSLHNEYQAYVKAFKDDSDLMSYEDFVDSWYLMLD